MQTIEFVVDCPVEKSFRVQQVGGMFDVTIEERSHEVIKGEIPDDNDEWQVGAIVGPSGAGKTQLINNIWKNDIYSASKWIPNKAVVDNFPEELSFKEIASLLTSVGFSTPRSWVRPYHALSTGQQFRCDLAKALSSQKPLIVYDEFTSVVDRVAAKIGSAAIAKHVRRNQKQRFVAVSCHYDMLEWLAPDWYLDMATGKLARGCLRRPDIQLDIERRPQSIWSMFAKYHYLRPNISGNSQMYVGVYDGQCVSCVAVTHHYGKTKRPLRHMSRVVVLPDFQGVGIGRASLNGVASLMHEQGFRVRGLTGHVVMAHIFKSDPHWNITDINRTGTAKRRVVTSTGRSIIKAEYV